MPKHSDADLDALRETFLDAQATYLARVSDTSDAAQECTNLEDAARSYEAACAQVGMTPDYDD